MTPSPENPPKRPRSPSPDAPQTTERTPDPNAKADTIARPLHVAGSGTLDRLVETAQDYARGAASDNTQKAYKADWIDFTRWCRRHGADPFAAPCPDPQLIGLYLTELATPSHAAKPRTYATIERRLSGLSWNYTERGYTLDRRDRHIALVLAGIKRAHARPPVQKDAILPTDILAMVATLPFDLRGLRDRAILLLGFAGGLRRSEIVGLDIAKDDTLDSKGWIEIQDADATGSASTSQKPQDCELRIRNGNCVIRKSAVMGAALFGTVNRL